MRYQLWFMRGLRLLIAVSFLGTAWFDEAYWLAIPGIWIGWQAFGKQDCRATDCPQE